MHNHGVELDIGYHVDHANDDSKRFYEAAAWVKKRFALRQLTASISIVDDPTIHELNRNHLQHDWPTDVISFVFEADDQSVEGEIIASLDTAAKMYEPAGWSIDDEILLYVVHGLLHLAGLDDVDDEQRREMRQLEQACLLQLGVQSADQHVSRWEDITY